MVYLEVAHVEDNGSDLFKFNSLERAVRYITSEEIVDYALADIPEYFGYGQDEYTHIED